VKPNDVIELVDSILWPQYDIERTKLKRIDAWYRWAQEDVHLPRLATTEHRKLVELSKTPWLGLVVSVLSQSMFVDGYKSPDAQANSDVWRTWQGNKFDARQIPLHRAALAYGYSFETVLPGQAPDGKSMAVMRGVSPMSMQAVYADPGEDDWPMYAIRVIPQPRGKRALRVYDEEFVYFLSCDGSGGGIEFIEARPHGAGVTPVVRFANSLDLEGRAPGEIEPFIGLAARINKTDYDRMLTQHFASWKVRYIAGMARPDDDESLNLQKIKLRQDDILVAEDADTKFGTLDATPLDGFIKAHDTDIETLAAVTQTPTFALNGQMTNLSADAIAAARAQLDQKVGERKVSFGESHAQALRLAAALEGRPDAANDVLSRVTWQDTSIRTLSAAADGLGKLATMLSVPPDELWSRIPGVSQADVEEWRKKARQGDLLAAVQGLLGAGAPPQPGAPAARRPLPPQAQPNAA
jgi:hypothetical protein